jgi:hypothetical protein
MAAFIKNYDLSIPKHIQKLPDWSYYKFLYMNPNAKPKDKLTAMKIYFSKKEESNIYKTLCFPLISTA